MAWQAAEVEEKKQLLGEAKVDARGSTEELEGRKAPSWGEFQGYLNVFRAKAQSKFAQDAQALGSLQRMEGAFAELLTKLGEQGKDDSFFVL